jgi:hypothetical protein
MSCLLLPIHRRSLVLLDGKYKIGTKNHECSVVLDELTTLLQNFGLRDGLPGTAYNKGVRAVEGIEAILIPVLREALADEEEVMKQGTVLGRLMQGLREEGADIMNASCDEKAVYFTSECLFLMFAGAASLLELSHIVFATEPEFVTTPPTHSEPLRTHA